jgi:hypothetical protein
MMVMFKGISLHIGINKVNKQFYCSIKVTDLFACENDAVAMQAIAKKVGYKSVVLKSESATYQCVTSAIADIASQLKSGDIFLLTYSGHGSQLFDVNGDESDRLDETWVLYDDQLIDDELYRLWSKFAPGVRILVISDSCHSGTVARFNQVNESVSRQKVSRGIAEKSMLEVQASGILISACKDNQVAWEVGKNGLFTSKLIEVWNQGSYRGTYRQFRNALAAKLPRRQSPNYFLFGSRNNRFVRQIPFTV